jgi:hypothetical protein
MIDTTFNIDFCLYEALRAASRSSGIPVQRIIVALLDRMVRSYRLRLVSGRGTRYQRRTQGSVWYRVHVRLSSSLHEKCMDFRKVLKRSVSSLLAECITNDLDAALRDLLLKGQDTYPETYLIFLNTASDNVHFSCFHAYPEKKTLREKLEKT